MGKCFKADNSKDGFPFGGTRCDTTFRSLYFVVLFSCMSVFEEVKRFAAVEGGGTSWTVAIMEGSPDNIVERHNVITESPSVTLQQIREWLGERKFDAIGIASFGPVDAKPSSPTYGYITSTPKPGWKNTDVLGLLGFRDEFSGIPFIFDTDVNAPAVAEYHHRRDSLKASTAYITVGTGVGVGLVVNGKSVHGLLHPEAGHIFVCKKVGDEFPGSCPYHGCCLEGMVSTGALSGRKGCHAADLPNLSDDDDVWDVWAYYVAQLCMNLVLIASPEHISIGGGVLNRPTLLPKVHKHFLELLNGYIVHEFLTPETVDNYITTPIWGANAGIMGAAYMAKVALAHQQL